MIDYTIRIFSIAGIIFLFGLSQGCFAQDLVDEVEAEDGELSGVNIASTLAGYSGDGYVTGFDNENDMMTVSVTVPERNFYQIAIKYQSADYKEQYLKVNDGFSSSVKFEQSSGFEDVDAGSYLFEKGSNTITIQNFWGYVNIDKFSIYTTVENEYNIREVLVDPNANATTVALYDYLRSIFGEKMISGQTDNSYDDINSITGKKPMLRAYDFQHYTEGYAYLWDNDINGHSFGAEDDGSVQRAIDWYNNTGKEGVVSFQWHWHSPSGGEAGANTFYTNSTDFDVTKAVTPGTPEYDDIIRDIDTIAYQLRRFEEADVPILWRPLHEAGGGWFWWGAKGPEACLELYNIIYDRMMNYHELHNLIWVWSSPEEDWYPGNDKVDIIGHDSYPGKHNYGTQKNKFDELYHLTGGEKLIAMTENGPIPDPEESLTLGAPWLFFMSWADLVKEQNSNWHLWEVYNYPDVLSFDGDEVTPPDPVTSVSDMNNHPFSMYPNPAKGMVRIDGDDISRIEIVDLKGQEIFNVPSSMDYINTSNFRNGVYIMRVYDHKNAYHFKLIVNN